MDVLTIGKPIPAMVARVKAWRLAGQEVRIFTARVGPVTIGEAEGAIAQLTAAHCTAAGMLVPRTPPRGSAAIEWWEAYQRCLIATWCETHLGEILPITCTKDLHMITLWDDRCVQVYSNTGQPLDRLAGV